MDQNSTLISNGTIVTGSDIFTSDILVVDEKIQEIGIGIKAPNAVEIDASGKYILPGGIDPHTHFDLPMFDTISSDDHYTGHKAAAFGGTTTVIDFVPQDYPTLEKCIEIWLQKASKKAAIDYSFHMNITSLNENIEAEIPKLLGFGISTVKMFMAYNGRLRLQDGEIFRIMRIAKEYGLLSMLHAENGDVIDILIADALDKGNTSAKYHALTRPHWGATEALLRGCALAAQAGAPLYVVHINTAGEVDQLTYAREKGVKVMGETCPQYLFFSQDYLSKEDGAKWVCSPPLRTDVDQTRLWAGIKQDEIQAIGTDHCAFFYNGSYPIVYENERITIPGKELGKKDFTKIPNGLPGVGDRLPILWTYGVQARHISINQFVNLTSTNPAKIFGLYPRKGALLPGSDADIVIWNPDIKVTYGVNHAHHRTDYNIFEGWELTGMPEKVFLRGKKIVDGASWLGKQGDGMFLQRSPGNQFM